MKNLTEIDDMTWVAIYQQQVAQYINNGIWLDEAQQLARELMDSVYVARSTALQCDTQKDYDDQREGDWTR